MTERPFLGPDQTYDKQRRCRLADVIGDYLQDEDCDARRFYEEMLSELNDWIDYHRRFARKGENMRELMMSGTLLFPLINRSKTIRISSLDLTTAKFSVYKYSFVA